MKANRILIAAVVLLLAGSISYLFWKSFQFDRTICRIVYQSCKEACERTKASKLIQVRFEEVMADRVHADNLLRCRIGPDRVFCEQEENREFAIIKEQFRIRKQQIEVEYVACVDACQASRNSCNGKITLPGDRGIAPPPIDLPNDCEGRDRHDEGCLVDVPEICKRMTSTCNECPQGCPGSSWRFSPSSQVEISLVAANSENDMRVLATNIKDKGKGQLLIVPSDIVLEDGERLCFFIKCKPEEKVKIGIEHL